MAVETNSENDRLPAQKETVRGGVGEYTLGEPLGDGGYGTVYACIHQGRHLAVKVEKYSKSMLFIEAAVLKSAYLRKAKHFCEMVDGGQFNREYVFIVMTLLGRDLHRLRAEQPDRRFSLSTGIRISIQCLDAIRELHDIGYISRDVKPGNFAPGNTLNKQHKTIFMFDFGLAKKYIDRTNTLYPSRGEVGWRGTTRYGSLVAHERQDLGRRDDIESWFYLMVEVTKGCLPWRLVVDRQQVQVAKQRARTEDRTQFLAGCPGCYENIMDEIDKLSFPDKPDYARFQQSLQAVCDENHIQMEDRWDWDVDITASTKSCSGEEDVSNKENVVPKGSFE